MQELVLALWREYACLAFFVTHDVTEALRVADRILVLSTNPATLLADIDVAATSPRPRTEASLRGADCRGVAQTIVNLIRGTGGTCDGSLDRGSIP